MENVQQRLEAFNANLNIINQHNAKKSTYKLGVNKFTDLSLEEFVSMYTGLPQSDNLKANTKFIKTEGVYPAEKDWRKDGGVVAIKDQGQCGSCYSFSATVGLESLNFNKNGKLVAFSEQ